MNESNDAFLCHCINSLWPSDAIWWQIWDSTWCGHQMETFSTLLALCAGNSPVPGEFPAQRPVTRSFDVFFDLRQNKRLSKQWWDWWFETPPSPLWRHCNDLAQIKACAWCHQTLTWTSIWLVGSGGIHMRAILNRVATLYNEFVNHTFKIIAISLRGQ